MKKTPERAAEILDSRPDLSDVSREYFEAIRDVTLPQFFLRKLQAYKKREDTILKPDIDSDHPDYRITRLNLTEHAEYTDGRKFKYTAGTIRGISSKLRLAMQHGIIQDPAVIAACEQFRSHDWNALRRAKKGTFWTTPEEITYMNQVLDLVINHLQETHGI